MLDARGATSSMSPRDGAGDEVPEYLDRATSQEKPLRADAGFVRFRASKSARSTPFPTPGWIFSTPTGWPKD